MGATKKVGLQEEYPSDDGYVNMKMPKKDDGVGGSKAMSGKEFVSFHDTLMNHLGGMQPTREGINEEDIERRQNEIL